MDLSKFIEETLTGMKDGIEAANKKTGSSNFEMTNRDKVDFDVALSISEKTAGKGQAKVGVISIASAGGEASIENQNIGISRVKFSVKISFNGFGHI